MGLRPGHRYLDSALAGRRAALSLTGDVDPLSVLAAQPIGGVDRIVRRLAFLSRLVGRDRALGIGRLSTATRALCIALAAAAPVLSRALLSLSR